MSLDRLQSKTGLFSITPLATASGFSGGIDFGGVSTIVSSSAADGGGALAPRPMPRATSAQTLSSGDTIFGNGAGVVNVVTSGGATTGVIMQAGLVHGQVIHIVNTDSSFSVTFAAAATSLVANGTGAVVAAVTMKTLVWNAITNRWYIN